MSQHIGHADKIGRPGLKLARKPQGAPISGQTSAGFSGRFSYSGMFRSSSRLSPLLERRIQKQHERRCHILFRPPSAMRVNLSRSKDRSNQGSTQAPLTTIALSLNWNDLKHCGASAFGEASTISTELICCTERSNRRSKSGGASFRIEAGTRRSYAMLEIRQHVTLSTKQDSITRDAPSSNAEQMR